MRVLRDRYAAIWRSTPSDPPGAAELGPERSPWRQWRNRRRVDRLIRRLCRRLRGVPAPGADRRRWEAELKTEVWDAGSVFLGWPESWRSSPLAESIAAASVDFHDRARALGERFGTELAEGELFQALRNLWIMNGLQVLLARPVATTPSVFAYSMLYPLTDNLLDDPSVRAEVKTGFSRRLRRRLAGEHPAPEDRREAAVFALVGEVEDEFPRALNPRVHASLRAIHRAQVRSLRQQDGPGTVDGPVDLLPVSCEKGGTSVLADGFLVAGELSPEEADFLFGYGVALQLLDDLQDATTDRAQGHRTLFSVAAASPPAADPVDEAGGDPLDEIVNRLARFTAGVLRSADRFDAPGSDVIAGLIRTSCPLLLLQAVAEQSGLFSPDFARRLERHFPVRFGALPRLRRRSHRRWRRTERALRRRGIVA